MVTANTKGKSKTGGLTRLVRLQPWYLLLRYPHRATRSIFAFVGGTLAIGIMCTAAMLTAQPMIFPSLGPSAFLFFTQPNAASSSPRNTILAHWSGVVVGALAYWLGSYWLGEGTSTVQIIVASISLGMISLLMITFDIQHPPAASTTLIASLGLMSQWYELLAVMISVVLLTYVAYAINRLSGVAFPLWHPRPTQNNEDLAATALATHEPSPQKNSYKDVANQLIANRGKSK